MEIIEKQVEKVKEVPTDGYYGYGRRDVNGKANAGLTLGIRSLISHFNWNLWLRLIL